MDTNYHIPQPQSILAILDKLDDETLLLPEFQRNYQWPLENSAELFDSLMRGIFIGSLIFSKPKFDLTCRFIDKRPRKGKGKRKKIEHKFVTQREFDAKHINVVLDGQQRITSLYRALKGPDDIFMLLKSPEAVPAEKKEEPEGLEAFVERFSATPSEKAVSVRVSDMFKHRNLREGKIRQDFFSGICKEYGTLVTKENEEEYFDVFMRAHEAFKALLKDKTVVSIFVLDMDLERFCMFFERSNSRGVALSFLDIITAKIYKGFNLREKREEYGESFSDDSLEDTAVVESFVRYLSFMVAEQVDRKTILDRLTYEHFTHHWDAIVKLYRKAKDVIEGQELLYRPEALTYKTMFIPVMHFISKLPHQDFTQASKYQKNFLYFWFWKSLYLGRFGGGGFGSTNEVIVADCKMLADVALGEGDKAAQIEFLTKWQRELTPSFDELLNIDSNGSKFVALMSYANHESAFTDLGNNATVNKKATNIHHIFPKKYIKTTLSEDEFARDNVDSILNKMIIGDLPNQKFKDKAPSDYLQTDPIPGNRDLNKALATHLIDEECAGKMQTGELDKNFKQFIQARAAEFQNKIFEPLEKLQAELLAEVQLKV